MTNEEALGLLNKTSKIEDKDFEDILKRWHSLYYAISLHTLGAQPSFSSLRNGNTIYPENYLGEEYQTIFDEMLFSRHPREEEATRQWRFSQYRPLTKGALSLLTEVVTGAIFQDSNYEITINNDEDNDYIWSNNFHGTDIAGYFSTVGYSSMIEDPNGYFLRIPKKPYYQQDKSKIDIDIWFVKTTDIVYMNSGELLFKKGNYAYKVNKQTIWRYVKNSEKKYVLADRDKGGYYAHMLGRLPITKAGGEWNTYGWYESYYNKAKPLCDEFVATFSAAQMVDKEASHPYIIEPNTDCPNPECHGGQINVLINDEQSTTNCPTCKGAGEISRNPGQRLILSLKDMKEGGDLKIVSPDTGINKLHRENVKELLYNIMDALNLTKIEEAQSGVAKAIDQERLYKFISKISNRLFDTLIYDTLVDITSYRNVRAEMDGVSPEKQEFEIVKPKQFKIETSTDLLGIYDAATKANMPIYARRNLMSSWVDKEYSGSEVNKKQSDFILYSDPLSVATPSEISALQATPEEVQYHRLIPMWLEKIAIDKGVQWFANASFKDIEKEVEAYRTATPIPKEEELSLNQNKK